MSDRQSTNQSEDYLQALAEELSVGVSAYEAADRSYKSLGEWLDSDKSELKAYSPAVYVQGSFRLGTAIKPLNEDEEYDLDAVCQLDGLAKSQLSQAQLKNLVGSEIERYRTAKNVVKPLKEGRRCWTLEYSDGAQFHMDILPALPNVAEERLLLEAANFDSRWADTAIVITDNENDGYNAISNDWNRSNPKGYAEWFKGRMTVILEKRRKAIAEATQASVEDIPDYKVLTPLQSAIMILKRHRDITFANDKVNRPISVILSSLSAHSYGGEERISDALMSILEQMDSHIEFINGRHVIANPIDPTENFADKWEGHPERAQAFFDWLEQARRDFGAATQMVEKSRISESLVSRIGIETATSALNKARNSPSSMLRPIVAVAGATTAAPSFADTPRKPTKPKGFA